MMSLGIETTVALDPICFFAEGELYGQDCQEGDLQKSPSTTHTSAFSKPTKLSYKENLSFTQKTQDTSSEFFKTGAKSLPCLKEKSDLANVMAARSSTPLPSPFTKTASQGQTRLQVQHAPEQKAALPKERGEHNPVFGQTKAQSAAKTTTLSNAHATTAASSKKESAKTEQKTLTPTATHTERTMATAVAGQWRAEKSEQWWEQRYHKREKEKEGGGQNGQQGGQQEHNQQEQGGQMRVEARLERALSTEQEWQVKKPRLTAPRLGIFSLYYILTKIEIDSNANSNFAAKQEIESLDAQTKQTHKERLAEMKVALEKERKTKRWGIAMKVFSWIASCFAIFAGIVMIATGVGAVTGAMLIAAGTIQIGSQIMEITGGWRKVADLLPGDDTDKKRAVIGWMQMGIAILCLLLTIGGVVGGGISNLQEAMSIVSSAIQSVAATSMGIVTIGEGIEQYHFRNSLAAIKYFDVRIIKLKALRQDLLDKVELGVERLEKLFEDIAQALKFHDELFEADQMAQNR